MKIINYPHYSAHIGAFKLTQEKWLYFRGKNSNISESRI